MIKSLNYFLQAILIYLFFLISRIIGIKASRKIFSFIFCLVGPFFKSKNIIKNNIKTLQNNGYKFLFGKDGELACGDYGIGRMSEPLNILKYIVCMYVHVCTCILRIVYVWSCTCMCMYECVYVHTCTCI